MFVMTRRLWLLALLFVTSASADPKPAIEGTFAFDWHHPKRSTCAKVTGKLRATLDKDYVCKAPVAGDPQSASGKPIVATCTMKKGDSEYLALATQADCKAERDTQLANGD
jgi:hypothetical protein